MLLEKPKTKGDVITLKLSTGEELVARFDSESDKELVVVKPMNLIMGQQGLGLSQYVFTVDQDQKIPIAKNHIITVMLTQKDMANDYIKNTTGLSLVK